MIKRFLTHQEKIRLSNIKVLQDDKIDIINEEELSNFYAHMQNYIAVKFHIDFIAGIFHWVCIEAVAAEETNERALKIGLYFDGALSGDCKCCGSRWQSVYERDATYTPMAREKSIDEYQRYTFDQSIFIHYLDGFIELIEFALKDSA